MIAAMLLLLAASGGAGRYPIALQVQPSNPARTATYNHQQAPSGLMAPPAESSVSFVGKQAVDAYSSFGAQFFKPDAQKRLTLDLLSVTPSIDLQKDGWHAVVQHVLELHDESDNLLGSWTIEGRGVVQGLGEGAVPAAFQAATVMAERVFEARFEEPPGVSGFLTRIGVAAGSVGRRPAVAEAPPPPPASAPFIHPEPRGMGVYLEAGGHFSDLSYQTTSRTSISADGDVLDSSKVAPGVDVRLGFATGWFFAQAVFTNGGARDGSVEHSLVSFGADAGVRVKLNRSLELAGGAGLKAARLSVSTYDFGPNAVTQTATQGYPDLMAAVYMTPFFGQRFHLHATFEARYRLTSFDTTYVNGDYHDHLSSGFSIALLLGVELPIAQWGKK
jgi:hypothetical protein